MARAGAVLLPLLALPTASAGGFLSRRLCQDQVAGASRWLPLGGGNQVVDDEGDQLFQAIASVEICGQICAVYPGCRSFAYCGNQVCFMRTRDVEPSARAHFNQFCTTYYRAPEEHSSTATSSTTTTSSPPPGVQDAAAAVCRTFRSFLAARNEQDFEGNPDADASGEVELTLCTDGNMSATLVVRGGMSQIIAAGVEQCDGGDAGGTAGACTGVPVIEFCGDNTPGLLSDDGSYPVACAGYNDQEVSLTKDMPGAPAGATSLSMQQLVRGILDRPELYFFNVHTMASYNEWYPRRVGACRGPLEPAPAASGQGTEASGGGRPSRAPKCHGLSAQLAPSEQQMYSDNPDSKASGSVSLKLCTNGTALATLSVSGGVTQIIATQIHMCQGSGDPEVRAGGVCEGPAVMNFCGDNSLGMLSDGTNYTAPCDPYNEIGISLNADMVGVLVGVTNRGASFSDRVEHIVQNPDTYYFNVHTVAEWNHWYPDHKGALRGVLRLQHQ